VIANPDKEQLEGDLLPDELSDLEGHDEPEPREPGYDEPSEDGGDAAEPEEDRQYQGDRQMADGSDW
jgi:hypothetical protein